MSDIAMMIARSTPPLGWRDGGGGTYNRGFNEEEGGLSSSSNNSSVGWSGAWVGGRRALVMGLRVFVIVTLLLLADAQKWPLTGGCQPCQCYYKISSFGRLRTVNCSQRGLTIIPRYLPPDLMALDLSRNTMDLQQLGQQLCKFKSLQSLSLSFVNLHTLSDILKGCSSMLELNLTGNRLKEIQSNTFQGLKNLRRLLGLEVESIASRNVFEELSNLQDLDLIFHGDNLPRGLFDNLAIQSLNLVLTKASSLPPRTFSFGSKTLNTLQVIGEHIIKLDKNLLDDLIVLRKLFLVMPLVEQLPGTLFHSQQQSVNEVVGRTDGLQEVDISGVQALPSTVFNQLPSLESLQLNEIDSLPQQAFMTQVVNLRLLVITGSHLTSVPAYWFIGLKNLKTLKLSRLQLQSLGVGALEGLSNLSYLDLSYNKLEEISSKMLAPVSQILETLILTGNALTYVNESYFEGLHSLRFLDMSENRLNQILANSFNGMNLLSVLYLNNNRLTSLPKDLFINLPKLAYLYLSDNFLISFPNAVLQLNKSLITLGLDFNDLRQVPADQLCEFRNLETVSIMGMKLHCTCRLLLLKQCPTTTFEGQCQTPALYQGQFLKDVELPASCHSKTRVKEISDQETTVSTEVISSDQETTVSTEVISSPQGSSPSLQSTIVYQMSERAVIRELFPENVTGAQSTEMETDQTTLSSTAWRLLLAVQSTPPKWSGADSASIRPLMDKSKTSTLSPAAETTKSISLLNISTAGTLLSDSLLQTKSSIIADGAAENDLKSSMQSKNVLLPGYIPDEKSFVEDQDLQQVVDSKDKASETRKSLFQVEDSRSLQRQGNDGVKVSEDGGTTEISMSIQLAITDNQKRSSQPAKDKKTFNHPNAVQSNRQEIYPSPHDIAITKTAPPPIFTGALDVTTAKLYMEETVEDKKRLNGTSQAVLPAMAHDSVRNWVEPGDAGLLHQPRTSADSTGPDQYTSTLSGSRSDKQEGKLGITLASTEINISISSQPFTHATADSAPQSGAQGDVKLLQEDVREENTSQNPTTIPKTSSLDKTGKNTVVEQSSGKKQIVGKVPDAPQSDIQQSPAFANEDIEGTGQGSNVDVSGSRLGQRSWITKSSSSALPEHSTYTQRPALNGSSGVPMENAVSPGIKVTREQAENGSNPQSAVTSNYHGSQQPTRASMESKNNSFKVPSQLNYSSTTYSMQRIQSKIMPGTSDILSDLTSDLQDWLQTRKGKADDDTASSTADLYPQELGSKGKKADKIRSQEIMAFNFTVSALTALGLFACTLIGVFSLRRWQQKGSYLLNDDTEMNVLSDSDSARSLQIQGSHRHDP